MPGDPLFDTLFRSTVAAPAIASAAPIRIRGTRSRAGNAMDRTRAAILDGARRAVEISGTRITMAQVAAAAGVAKATLYNHFRTREAVLSALLMDEVSALVDRAAGRTVTEALTTTAGALSEHPLLRALARIEPATLAALARVDRTAEGWQVAAAALDAAFGAPLDHAGDLVLRWLASYVTTPGTPVAVGAEVELMLAALAPVLTRPVTVGDLPAQSA